MIMKILNLIIADIPVNYKSSLIVIIKLSFCVLLMKRHDFKKKEVTYGNL